MDYQIIIKVPFEAIDDIEARTKAKDIIQDPVRYLNKDNIKFQRVHKDKAPEGIPL
jgi:hypothetical protein